MARLFTRARLFYALGLLVLVLVTQWLRQQEESGDAVLAGQPHYHSDYEMRGFALSAFDRAGVLQHELAATHMAHYPQDGMTRIEAPQVTVYQQGRQHWVLRAEHGEFDQTGEQARLKGAVSLAGTLQGSGQTLQMRTRDVMLDLAQRRASTRAPLQAEVGQASRINAGAMQLDLEREQLELTSRVSIIYENQP